MIHPDSKRGIPPASLTIVRAGIGAVLATLATASLRGFGRFHSDPVYAWDKGLHRVPTLWFLLGSLSVGIVGGAIMPVLFARSGRSPEGLVRPVVTAVLLVMLACLIHFVVWELQALYVEPGIY